MKITKLTRSRIIKCLDRDFIVDGRIYRVKQHNLNLFDTESIDMIIQQTNHARPYKPKRITMKTTDLVLARKKRDQSGKFS